MEKKLSINGTQFLCRLLKVGAKENEPNEWDAALDIIDGNLIWEWLTFDWGQEGSFGYRVLRGGGNPRTWYDAELNGRFRNYGYRPALELLPSEQLTLGKQICAIGGQSILYGTLLEATDYDLLVQPEQTSILADADAGKLGSQQPDGTVAVVRSKMIVQEIR